MLTSAEVVLGRDPAGIVLDDETVSRRHAIFRWDGPTVEDLGSSNGTFVNGQRVVGRTRLQDGDLVLLGQCQLKVVKISDHITFDGYTQPIAKLPSPALTPRERQVFELFVAGVSQKKISAQLGISVKTVETHRTNIGQKLGLKTRAEFVQYALDTGILK